MDRNLRVEGLVNARDLGGLPLIEGGTTPTGVFLRSERPDLVSEGGWRTLRALGVRTVLDLRQPEERSARPGTLPAGITDLHVDHDGLEHADFWSGHWHNGLVGTPVYDAPHLAALPERTTAVLSAVATAPAGAALCHCAGGRARTGLVAAVLLRIAGATDDAIVEDHLLTIANSAAMSAAQGRPDDESSVAALLAEHGITSEEALRDFLSGLDTERLLAPLPPEQAAALVPGEGRCRLSAHSPRAVVHRAARARGARAA